MYIIMFKNLETVKSTISSIKQTLTKFKNEGETDPFKNELQILELYPEFYDQYPFLVKKLCKGDDISMLYHMLEKLNEINTGNLTLEHVEKELGEQLFDKYISPNLKK